MREYDTDEIAGLTKAFDKIKRNSPAQRSVTDIFADLLINRARFKAYLSERADFQSILSELPGYYSEAPYLNEAVLVSLSSPIRDTLEFAIPILVGAFPGIRTDLVRIGEAVNKGDIDLAICITSLVRDREEYIDEITFRLNIKPEIFRFFIGQIVKPFIEITARRVGDIVRQQPWSEGHCPVCGSLPELSFLRGDAGERWLRCSLCGYEWRFDRMVCPYCGERKYKMESIWVEGRRHEWAELCDKCHRYIVGTDIRKQMENAITDVAAIGMIYLDVLAQRRGFSPMAECVWNTISEDSVIS